MINVSPCKKSDYNVLSQIEKSNFQDPISKIELNLVSFLVKYSFILFFISIILIYLVIVFYIAIL